MLSPSITIIVASAASRQKNHPHYQMNHHLPEQLDNFECAGSSDQPLHGEPVGKALRLHGGLVQVTKEISIRVNSRTSSFLEDIFFLQTENKNYVSFSCDKVEVVFLIRSRGSLCPATGETSLSNETRPDEEDGDVDRWQKQKS